MHFNVRSKAHRLAARMDPDWLATIQAQASKDAAARQSALAAGKTMDSPKDDSNKYPTYVRQSPTAAPTTAAAQPTKAADTSNAVPNSDDGKAKDTAAVPSSDEKKPTAAVVAPAPAQSSNEPAPSSNTPSPAAPSTEEKEETPSTEDKATPSAARSPVSTSSEALEAEPSSSETRATSADRKLSSSSSLSASPSNSAASKAFKPIAASSAAATEAAQSTGMSGGAVAGIVIAVLLGVAALAIIAGWYLRQKKRQERQVNNPWGRMNNSSDDNITPFPAYSEKPDDYYGDNDAPVIGSNRALALARQNAFYADGTPRPDSTAMNPNFAGYGAGRSYGPYPTAAPGTPHSHHFSEQHQQYQDNPFHDQYQYQDDAQLVQLNEHSGPRQLVGPGQAYGAGGVPVPVPAPVPLGRPEAPQTYDDIAAAEAYADDRYADDHMPAQHASASVMPAAVATGAVAGGAAHQGQQQQQQPEQGRLIDTGSSDEQHMPDPTPLPQLRPMSPLMPLVDVDQQSSAHGHGQPSNLATAAPVNAHHSSPSSDEMDRMYNEVANYAGVPQPDGVQEATRLPPQPYVHGQPLTPLVEQPTPKSDTASLAPAVTGPVQAAPPAARALPTPPQQAQAPAASPKPEEEDAYGGI